SKKNKDLFKQIDFTKYDLIVVSDYDKLTLDHFFWDTIFSLPNRKIIDLKKYRKYFEKFDFKNCIIKCNDKEWHQNEVSCLRSKVDVRDDSYIITTLGSKGF